MSKLLIKNDTRQTTYSQPSYLEHVRKKSHMYIPPKELQKRPVWVLKETFEQQNLNQSPGLEKLFDEIIVNACDHYSRQAKTKNKVTKIEITYKNGEVSILNNGPGIPIYETKSNEGTTMMSPELIFTQFLAGSNVEKSSSSTDAISGGDYGLGSKLTAAFSEYFTVETIDPKTKIYYKQTYRNGLSEIEAPVLQDSRKTHSKEEQKGFTKITYKPLYGDGFPKHTKELEENMNHIYKFRSIHSSIYTKTTVIYNEEEITIKTLNDFASLFTSASLYQSTVIINKYPIEFIVAVDDSNQIGIINGIHVKDGGSHIKAVVNHIVTVCESKIKKEIKGAIPYNKNLITNNLFVFMNAQIPDPRLSGQEKSKLECDISYFDKLKLSKTDIDAITEELVTIISQSLGKEKKTRVKRVVNAADYFPATNLKKKNCGLILTEGLSATGSVKKAMSEKTDINSRDYGIYSLRGVPINARKESEIKKVKGETVKIRSLKLKNNERFSTVVEIIGLDYTKTYDDTKEGDKDFKNLSYQFILMVMDADEDAKNIAALTLSALYYFWPALIKRGFVRRLLTPIIRAYPSDKKKKVEEFYTMSDFKEWSTRVFKGAVTGYKIKYLKGIGSHSPKETVWMFSNIKDKIMTFTEDDITEETFEIYYGKDPDKRKTVLSTPVDDNIKETINMRCSDFLHMGAKSFQLYAIHRKMPSSIDGMVPVHRKCVAGAKKKFAVTNSSCRTYQLGGFIAEHMNYAHGDSSLLGAIEGKTRCFRGATKFPPFIGESSFGNAGVNGDDCASARYTDIRLNKELVDLLFPVVDEPLLDYVIDEGKRCEPEYYVPIVPLSILEIYESPAVGYKVGIYARDVFCVLDVIRGLIKGMNVSDALKATGCDTDLKACTYQYGGIRMIKNAKGDMIEHSMGEYAVDKKNKAIKITAIPLRLATEYWILGKDKNDPKTGRKIRAGGIIDDPLVVSVEDKSDDNINILIKLTDNAFDEMAVKNKSVFTDVEQYFGLKKTLAPELNLVNTNGAVICYEKYIDILLDWYSLRKVYYERRIDRQILILEMKIVYFKNVIRYTDLREEYGLNKKSEEYQDSVLSKEKYDKIHKSKLFSNYEIRTENLKDEIFENGNYNYLCCLNSRDMTDKRQDDNKKKLKELENELKRLKKKDPYFKGASQWLEELDAFEALVRKARSEGTWNFEEKNYKR